MEKVAPSERFRSELDVVLAGVGGDEDPIETVGRLGARLILQQALEDEVTEFLGRRRYERAGETVSHRNGYEERTVKTTSGAMRLERPRVRDAKRLGFESRILGKGVARTHALESLVSSENCRNSVSTTLGQQPKRSDRAWGAIAACGNQSGIARGGAAWFGSYTGYTGANREEHKITRAKMAR